MSDWNPSLYLKFEEGRNKPIYDLIAHIPVMQPKRIIDIGCGPGNSTAPLAKMYPGVEIIGIDSSPSMIAKAKKEYPDMEWMVFDANRDLSDFGSFELVFTNSVLHWLPDHERLLPRLFGLLSENGVFAAQIPYFLGTPIYEPLYALIQNEKWDKYFLNKQPTTYRDIGFYYDILSSHFSEFDLWTTKYTHVLHARSDMMEWYKPTAFKALTDQLDTEELKELFLSDVWPIVNDLYHPQKDGKYLFRFEHFFFVARRTE